MLFTDAPRVLLSANEPVVLMRVYEEAAIRPLPTTLSRWAQQYSLVVDETSTAHIGGLARKLSHCVIASPKDPKRPVPLLLKPLDRAEWNRISTFVSSFPNNPLRMDRSFSFLARYWLSAHVVCL
jgi:hypothetical protein